MKKKFVLTLALVLMVAVSLTAAPLEVSGEFSAGYDFTLDSAPVSTGGADIDSLVAFTGDFWKVTLADGVVPFGGEMTAEAEIYLDKALAAQGVDMGDLAVTLGIGSKGSLKPADVYTDSNDAVAELNMLATGNPVDVTVGYGSLVTAYLGADPTDTINTPFVLGVTTTPVAGIKAGLGYTNYALVVAAADKVVAVDAAVATPGVAAVVAADEVAAVLASTSPGITGSFTVDVAALAGLDFGLTVSAIDVYHFEDSRSGDAVNKLYTEVTASYSDVAAWAEYQLIDGTSNVAVKVSYSGIENVGMYAKVALDNLSEIATTISGGASYAMGGVKYALDAEYVVDGAFTLTPSVIIAF